MILEYLTNKFLRLIAEEVEKNNDTSILGKEVVLRINGTEYPIKGIKIQCKHNMELFKIILEGETK